MWKIFFYALGGYAILCIIVFIFQRQLLYLPSKVRLTEEDVSRLGLVFWPSFDQYLGFSGVADLEETTGTVVVFHGNAGQAYHRSFYADALSPLSLRVILVEYPGYGGRSGRPSEDVLVKDGLEVIRLAYEAYGEPIYLWGESLGCGVAAGVIKDTDIPIKAAVMFLPWDTISSLAQRHYWYFPVRWLVLDKYDNIENLKGFEGKIAVLLAGEDEVTPVQHGMRLYDSIMTNKRLWVFEGSRHNEVPVRAELQWWDEVIDYISQ